MEVTEIKPYIGKALEKEKFVNWEIISSFFTDSEGYFSNIVFATVIGTTGKEIQKQVEIVVKISRDELIATNKYKYDREVYVYNTILPEFVRFQIENDIENKFDSFPKCYSTMSDNSKVVIVMENLMKSGYVMYDCSKPLNLDHLGLVLSEFGKLHAISFALRHKSRDVFEKLVATFDSVKLKTSRENFGEIVKQRLGTVCDILKEMNEIELVQMCKNLQKGADVAMVELLAIEEPQSVILHGDCWNNNFLYKYEPENDGLLSKVAFLDWQFSSLHSPVVDLSYLIYTTCSGQELEHFDELLHIYHTSFSNCLKEFGCDAEKIFSFSDLQRHWKEYSLYGIFIVTTLLRRPLCETAKNLDINEAKDGKDWEVKLANVKKQNEIAYRKRLVASLTHYYKYCYM